MEGLRERKHLVLLLVGIFVLAAQPLMHGHLLGLVIYDVAFALVVAVALLLIFPAGRARLAGLALAAPAVVCNWLGYGLSGGPAFAAQVAYHALAIGFLAAAVAMTLRQLFALRDVRVDHVIGSCCGYLLAGIAWGNAYTLTELVAPDSFSIKQDLARQLGDEHRRRFLFDFYSFTTISSLGYGAITPVAPAAASLTWMEAVFGQFYLAVVVAQLVGLRLARAVAGRAGGETLPADEAVRDGV
jgi:hypothetical protein